MRLRQRLLDPPVPIHLLFVPLALPLALVAANSDLAPPVPSVSFVLGAWALVVLPWICLSHLAGNTRRAAAAIAIVAIAFYLDLAAAHATASVPWLPVVAWVVVLLGCVRLVRSRTDPKAFTIFANIFFGSASAILVAQIVASGFNATPALKRGYLQMAGTDEVSKAAVRPDVYIFVLDGYGRADVLRSMYGYEDEFVHRLRRNGFYVADEATSNYAQTALSLASSLNLDYLTSLLEPLPTSSSMRQPCQRAIADNRLFRAFERAGYRIVTFGSEYAMLRFAIASDEQKPAVHLTDFDYSFFAEGPLARLSRLAGLPPAFLPHQARRRYVQWTLDRLASGALTDDRQPSVVFVHLLLPHPPFTFKSDGGYTWTESPSGIFDGDHWRARAGGHSLQKYVSGYRENARFVGNRVAAIIEQILKSAKRPTAILVHGDHGPGSRLFWENAAASDMKERLGILLALRLPTPAASRLYPTLTPVNAYRLLLNTAVGTDLPLLDDRAWFSTWSRPYQFLDVTARAAAGPDPVVAHLSKQIY